MSTDQWKIEILLWISQWNRENKHPQDVLGMGLAGLHCKSDLGTTSSWGKNYSLGMGSEEAFASAQLPRHSSSTYSLGLQRERLQE